MISLSVLGLTHSLALLETARTVQLDVTTLEPTPHDALTVRPCVWLVNHTCCRPPWPELTGWLGLLFEVPIRNVRTKQRQLILPTLQCRLRRLLSWLDYMLSVPSRLRGDSTRPGHLLYVLCWFLFAQVVPFACSALRVLSSQVPTLAVVV